MSTLLAEVVNPHSLHQTATRVAFNQPVPLDPREIERVLLQVCAIYAVSMRKAEVIVNRCALRARVKYRGHTFCQAFEIMKYHDVVDTIAKDVLKKL